ncbi:MAG: hypothetical protein ACRDG8_06720 [Actinomycetota bacterium]
MRGWAEETNGTKRRKLRRSAGVWLALLLFPLLTISPSRATTCQLFMLTFSNVPDQRILEVQPRVVVSIVGEYWTNDCVGPGGGGACYGPGNERPMKNIDVELVRRGTSDAVVVAEGISARGEDESWFLSFRVPDLSTREVPHPRP